MNEFRNLCAKERMHELKWPDRDYIVQVARFDPSKGLPNVLDSYCKLRNLLKENSDDDHPQLLICGHGAVDDPDASIIYDQVMKIIDSGPCKEYAEDIVVMRLPPSDQRAYFSVCLDV
jgi:glycosyltransferase involved in cell wall biosynthesis